jgi:hypothetical protein
MTKVNLKKSKYLHIISISDIIYFSLIITVEWISNTS